MALHSNQKSAAASLAAMSIAAVEMGWEDIDGLGQRLRGSQLSAGDLTAVAEAVRPFVRIGKSNPSSPIPAGIPPLRPEVETEAALEKTLDLKAWAKDEIIRHTGHPLVRIERGETYRAPSGRRVHLRSMHPYDRGNGRFSCWFGLAEDRWQEDDLFILVCGTLGILVVPVRDWLKYKPLISRAKEDTEVQPSIWFNDGQFELRAQGEHFDVTGWVNRFDLL